MTEMIDWTKLQTTLRRVEFATDSAYSDNPFDHALIISLDKFALTDTNRTSNGWSRLQVAMSIEFSFGQENAEQVFLLCFCPFYDLQTLFAIAEIP